MPGAPFPAADPRGWRGAAFPASAALQGPAGGGGGVARPVTAGGGGGVAAAAVDGGRRGDGVRYPAFCPAGG